MNKEQTLVELFTAHAGQVSIKLFLINLLISALLAHVLGRAYGKFGTTLSNREHFGRNFLLITMTTMLIITIVKSSLALSLGLVGALSIIRFRAAIKEPEELSYLFLAISIGLGLGAEQTAITVIAFIGVMAIIITRHYLKPSDDHPNLYVTVTAPGGKVNLPTVLDVVTQNTSGSALKRFDETPDVLEAAFQARFKNLEQMNQCASKLRALAPGMKVSFLEQNGLVA